MSPILSPKDKLKALLAKRNSESKITVPINNNKITEEKVTDAVNTFDLNPEQAQGVQWALSGESFCLTGPAGSGKTFTIRRIINALMSSDRNRIIHSSTHKHLPKHSVPGILSVAFTNKAVENIKKNLPKELQSNCLTIHKLLEFGPEKYLLDDGTESQRFVPYRTKNNPLPEGIYAIIIEESSMVDVPLWNMLVDAIPPEMFPNIQIIIVGDIQQLPPVFGKSIFIHAMEKGIKTVELHRIYRQAQESPILSLAHRVLSGNIIPAKSLMEWHVDKSDQGMGKVYIQPWKKTLSDIAATLTIKKVLPKMIDEGIYDPFSDIILTPFNKSFGTNAMNEAIASHVAKKLNAPVWEIFTGIAKVYMRIGERVLYLKSEATVTNIKPNPAYYGKIPREPSTTLSYDGHDSDPKKHEEMSDEQRDVAMQQVEAWLEAMGSHLDDSETKSQQASHIITVKSEDTGQEYELKRAGDIAQLLLGYALTVHKAQGSEYNKVFFITHKSQGMMLFRELLYTAITRAKNELHIICEPTMFTSGINSQRVPGKNVKEKIEQFKLMQERDLRNGTGNIGQIPVDLDRFISEDEEQGLIS